MLRTITFSIVASSAILFGGCPPTTLPDAGPPVPAPTPAQDASPPAAGCQAACSNAGVLGCPEGKVADCVVTCSTIAADPLQVHPNLTAIAAAKTVNDVRAAGWTCRAPQ